MNVSTLCYVKKDGRTLMLHRIKKPNDVHEGKYNGLGGKFFPGELPEECVIREVQEESGLLIKKPRLRGVMMFPAFKDNEDWLVFLFTANEFSGTLGECNEGRLEWVEDTKLRSLNLWEGDKLFLDWMDQNKFFSAKFIYKNKQLVDHQVTFYHKTDEIPAASWLAEAKWDRS